ncbi:MAG: TrkH family potassium uptake protein [Neomegalonema sp.]|nr:TrkH family potassium uptake protein [Neomegalonema sp.]
MFDFKPVGYVVGLFILFIGVAMLPPALLDYYSNSIDWRAFLVSSILTCLTGGALALGCESGKASKLSIPQTFLLVVLTWVLLPFFGALPFAFGEIAARPIDAFFEAVSGLTTTGATVLKGLDTSPPGALLWRGLLQWIGGVGVVIFAVAFLPSLRIGGMQLFARADGGDPETVAIYAVRDIGPPILITYALLTLTCALVYGFCGMGAFDAFVHAMTTVATGGFANYDKSFAAFSPAAQYASVLFMAASALPLLRYADVAQGKPSALWEDTQVRGFAAAAAAAVAIVFAARVGIDAASGEQAFRESLFNAISLMTGTGYVNTNYDLVKQVDNDGQVQQMANWPAAAVITLFLIGLLGGCAGSTSCSVKIFRYQILGAVAYREFQQARYPSGIFALRYGGRRITSEVETSVVAFFFLFFSSLGVLTLMLAMTGLDLTTALSGAAATLANIGPGFGPIIGPDGNYRDLPDSAKSLLIIGMLLGRLELLSVLVLFSPGFWRK